MAFHLPNKYSKIQTGPKFFTFTPHSSSIFLAYITPQKTDTPSLSLSLSLSLSFSFTRLQETKQNLKKRPTTTLCENGCLFWRYLVGCFWRSYPFSQMQRGTPLWTLSLSLSLSLSLPSYINLEAFLGFSQLSSVCVM